MASNQTSHEAAQSLGFEQVGGVFFGTWQGYAVTQYMNQSYWCIQFAVRTNKSDRALAKTLQADVKAQLPKQAKGCQNLGQSVSFNMKLTRAPMREQFETFLNVIAGALRLAGVAPADTCAYCGGQTPDSYCLVKTYQPVHAACVRSAKEDAVEKAQQNQESGSYLTGTLGALVGTLVGIIPTILTILLTERIYALLFALVPLAAMYGYRLCRGKQSKASIAIIIVLSLLGVLVLQTIVTIIGVAQDAGISFGESVSLVVPYVLSSEGFPMLMSDSAMDFLFMALGIFFAWRYLNQTNEHYVAAANAVASTLRPIHTASDPDTTGQV